MDLVALAQLLTAFVDLAVEVRERLTPFLHRCVQNNVVPIVFDALTHLAREVLLDSLAIEPLQSLADAFLAVRDNFFQLLPYTRCLNEVLFEKPFS